MNSFLNPDEVLDTLNLKPDMVAAEFGCGAGGFTFPLARRLEDGLVFAIDIQESVLSALKSRALLENIVNINVIHSDLERPRGSTLSSESLDLVLIPNVLFQIEDKDAIIKEAKRVLKNNGKLIIIDWLENAACGPLGKRIKPDEVKSLAEKNGFKLEKEFRPGIYHYGLTFLK